MVKRKLSDTGEDRSNSHSVSSFGLDQLKQLVGSVSENNPDKFTNDLTHFVQKGYLNQVFQALSLASQKNSQKIIVTHADALSNLIEVTKSHNDVTLPAFKSFLETQFSVIQKILLSRQANVLTAVVNLLDHLVNLDPKHRLLALVYSSLDFTSLKNLYQALARPPKVKEANPLREAFIRFMTSLFEFGSSDIRTELTSQKKLVTIWFKSIYTDPPELIVRALKVFRTSILDDDSISRSTKSKFFNEWVLSKIEMIYIMPTTAATEPAHDFLTHAVSTPGNGICFKVNDFLGRLADPKVHNRALLGLLKGMSLTNQLEQDLALTILRTCPELVYPWALHICQSNNNNSRSARLLGANLSGQWVTAAQFSCKLIRELPIPSFHQKDTTEDSDAKLIGSFVSKPSSIEALLNFVLPFYITSGDLTSGILHPSALVKYFTLQIMHFALLKFQALRNQISRRFVAAQSETLINAIQDRLVLCFPEIRHLFGIVNSQPSSSLNRFLSLKVLASFIDCSPKQHKINHALSPAISQDTFDKVDVKGVDLVSIVPLLEIHSHTLGSSKWYNKAGGRGKSPYSMFTALLRFAVCRDYGVLTSKVVSHLTKMVAPTQLFFNEKQEATIMGLAPLIASLKAFVVHFDDIQNEAIWSLIDESVARAMRSPYAAFDDLSPYNLLPLHSPDQLLANTYKESDFVDKTSTHFDAPIASDYHGIFYVVLCTQLKFLMNKHRVGEGQTKIEDLTLIKEWFTVALALSTICGWDNVWYDRMMSLLSENEFVDDPVFSLARQDMDAWMLGTCKMVTDKGNTLEKMTHFQKSVYSAPLFFMNPNSWIECRELVPELLEQRIPILTDPVEFLKLVLFSELDLLLKVSHCRCQLPEGSVWGPVIFPAFITRCASLRDLFSSRAQRWSVCSKICQMMKAFVLDNVESMSPIINSDRPELAWRRVFYPCFLKEAELPNEIFAEIGATFVDILADFSSYELSASSYHLLLRKLGGRVLTDESDSKFKGYKSRISSAFGRLSYKYRIEPDEDYEPASLETQFLAFDGNFFLSALKSWIDHKVLVHPLLVESMLYLPRVLLEESDKRVAILELFRKYSSWLCSQDLLYEDGRCNILTHVCFIDPPVFNMLDFSRAVGLIIQRDHILRQELARSLAEGYLASNISLKAQIVLFSSLLSSPENSHELSSFLSSDHIKRSASECVSILKDHENVSDKELISDCMKYFQYAVTTYSTDERISVFRTVNDELYDSSNHYDATIMLHLLCRIVETTPGIDEDLLISLSKNVSSTILRLTKTMAESSVLSEAWLALSSALASAIANIMSISRHLGVGSLNSLMEVSIPKASYSAVQKLMLAIVTSRAASKRTFQYTKFLMLLLDLTPSKNPLSYDFEMFEGDQEEGNDSRSPHSDPVQLRRARLAAITHSLFVRDPVSHALPHVLETILLSYSGTVYPADRLLSNVIQSIESSLNVSCLQQAESLSIEMGSEKKSFTLSLFSRGTERNRLQVNIRQSMMESTVRTVARPRGDMINLSDVKPDFSFYDSFTQLLPEQDLRNVYDPHLILPVIAMSLKSGSIGYFVGPGYTEMLRAHFLGVPLAALGSFNDEIVEPALVILEYAFNTIEEWPIRDKSGIKIILSRAFSAIDQFKTKKDTRQDSDLHHIYPAIIGIFLGLSVRIVTDPSYFLYEKVTKFLLNSPLINPNIVPLYDTIMLGDDSDHFRQVNWMVEMLCSGLQSEHDMVLYDKANVVDDCLSLETYCRGNTKSHMCQSIIKNIMKMIWQAQSISNGATRLVTKHAMITLPLILSSRDCGSVMQRNLMSKANDKISTGIFEECRDQFGMFNRMAIRTYLGADRSKLKEWTLQKGDSGTQVVLPSQFIDSRSQVEE